MDLKRSVLVPYPMESMFDLIEQAEHYPEFLPWCIGAKILERSDEWVAARIEFSYLQVRFGFQTRNPKRRPEWLQVRLVQGPFKRFTGDWHLTPLGAHGCRINFDLSYEIAEGLLDKVAARAVEMVSRSMMDAFVKRAEATLPKPGSVQAVAAPVAVSASPAETAAAAEPVRASESASEPAPASLTEPLPEPWPSAAAPPQPLAAVVELPASTSVATMSPTSLNETTMSTIDPALLEAVAQCPLARELNPEQVAVLASLMQIETYQPRQILATEGQVDNRLYVVVEGSLAVTKHLATPDETLLATLNPGDFAHELGFLDGAQRYASLLASSPARVLVLEREKLESLITTHPMVLYRVMCAIVRTVHRIQTRLSMQASELTNYIVKQHGRY